MLHLPERIHKRPFVVAVIVFIAFLIASGIMLISLGFFGTGSNLMRVKVSSAGTGTAVNGIGMNLPYIPTMNLLVNPSFEDTQSDQIYTVFEGTDNSVFVLPDSNSEKTFSDGFFTGGSMRVMSIDESGQLVQKLQASVTDFQMDQLGLWTPLTAASGIKENQQITSISSSSRLSIAAGKKGLLISDISSSAPTLIDLGITDDLVSSSCVSDRFFAVTASGDFASSSDGKTWSVFSPDFVVPGLIHTVSSIGKIGIAAGDFGKILLCADGKVTSVSSGESESIMTSTSDGTALILGCMNGKILTTSNGVIYRELTAGELPANALTANWICSDYSTGQFVLGGDQGQVAIGYSSADHIFSFSSHQAKDAAGNQISIQSIHFLPTGELIIRDTSGLLFCSKDQGTSWKPLSVESISSVDALGVSNSGRILLSQGVSTFATQLYTRIEFDDVQSENIFQPGDMCFLQRLVPSDVGSATSDQESTWQVFGDASSVQIQNKAPSGGGETSLNLKGSASNVADQTHYISQVIAEAGSSPFQKNKFYKIEVWLKQDGIGDGKVMAWISGQFTSIGTTFSDVGSGWRQYTYTFVLPSSACGDQAGQIRLNIGFTGTGNLSIDRAYLGLDKYSSASLPDSFTNKVSKAAPGLIRLQNLGIGKMDVSSQAWILSAGNEAAAKDAGTFTSAGCMSLEESLSLVRSVGGDPWLVIGSSASQTTIDNLLAYLCGSLTDPYGKLRIENGTAVPWGIQFNRLVIEISDEDGVFSTDLQRGAYVNYMIRVIKSSPFYVDIKGRIVFLDGMIYDGGTMQSEADYHTGDLLIANQKQTISGIQTLSLRDALSEGYASYFDMIPRTPSHPQEGGFEWIRSSILSLTKNGSDDAVSSVEPITAADFCEMLLYDLGNHSSTILFNLPVSSDAKDADTSLMFAGDGIQKTADKYQSAQNNETILAVSAVLADIVHGETQQVEITPPYSAGTQKTPATDTVTANGLTAYAYKDAGKIHLIVTNTSEQSALFLLESDRSLNGAHTYRYSSAGKLIQKNKLGRQGNQINLLPGQFVVVEIAAGS